MTYWFKWVTTFLLASTCVTISVIGKPDDWDVWVCAVLWSFIGAAFYQIALEKIEKRLNGTDFRRSRQLASWRPGQEVRGLGEAARPSGAP